jgi:hypothetical protein
MKKITLLLATLAVGFSLPAPAMEIGDKVPGYPETQRKIIISREDYLKLSYLKDPDPLPVPGKALALPDDWATGNAPVSISIRLSQNPPGTLLVRRVGNNDGKLYLEIYVDGKDLAGDATLEMGGTTLDSVNVDGSVWLSLKPRIAKLTINILNSASGKIQTLVSPTTLVEVSGRQILLNGEPYLVRGGLGGPQNAQVAAYFKGIGVNTLRGKRFADGETYSLMVIESTNVINVSTSSTNFFPLSNVEFNAVADPAVAAAPAKCAAAIASPNTLILQLGNECSANETAPGTYAPNINGVPNPDRGRRHVGQILARVRNVLKQSSPMMPLGYANQDSVYLTPDCIDVYMHNSYYDTDRFQYPWELFLKWQGCVPPYGPTGQGRPFVSSEYAANVYRPQSYIGGPNIPVLEKLHAWAFTNIWGKFMKHGTAGGTTYTLSDDKVTSTTPDGSSCFGIITYDYKPKLIAWDVAQHWRDFTVDANGDNLLITNRRDNHARDCHLTITPVTPAGANGTPVQIPLDDFEPNTSRVISLKSLGIAGIPDGFRWSMAFDTHSGLAASAVGAWPRKLEEQDFLALIKSRDTGSFLTELFDAEVLTADGKPAPQTLYEMTTTDSRQLCPVILRKPNGVIYLFIISRVPSPGTPVVKNNITLDIAFNGTIEQVDDMTGEPLTGQALADAGGVTATPIPGGGDGEAGVGAEVDAPAETDGRIIHSQGF